MNRSQSNNSFFSSFTSLMPSGGWRKHGKNRFFILSSLTEMRKFLHPNEYDCRWCCSKLWINHSSLNISPHKQLNQTSWHKICNDFNLRLVFVFPERSYLEGVLKNVNGKKKTAANFSLNKRKLKCRGIIRQLREKNRLFYEMLRLLAWLMEKPQQTNRSSCTPKQATNVNL